MKRLLHILICISVVFILQGCTNEEQVTVELIEYHNNGWRTFQKMKKEKVKPIASKSISLVLEENDQGIEIVIKEELLRVLNEMVEHLESIQLKTKEVQNLKQLEIEAERFNYDDFKEAANILDNGNADEIDAMYEQFGESNKELEEKYDEIEDEREKLMEKYDVEFIVDYDEDGNRVMEMVRKEED
ncbi:MAG TPA: hypothetical protein VK072_01055 [Candidatus Avamphibacillus sp.]|nr:hypothetical protein [Candidatus Avamphibacillus sp.]